MHIDYTVTEPDMLKTVCQSRLYSHPLTRSWTLFALLVTLFDGHPSKHSLDQVTVWITAVHTPQLSYSSRPFDNLAAFQDLRKTISTTCTDHI